MRNVAGCGSLDGHGDWGEMRGGFATYPWEYKREQDDKALKGRYIWRQGWGTARASYMAAIHDEWIARGFDFSMIGDSRRLSFRHKVRLGDGVVRMLGSGL